MSTSWWSVLTLASGHRHGQAALLLLVRRGHRQGAENSQSVLLGKDGEAPGDLRSVARRAVAGVHRKRRWARRLLLPVGDLVLFRLVSRARAVTGAVQPKSCDVNSVFVVYAHVEGIIAIHVEL